MKRTKNHIKHIACLERSFWYEEIEDEDRISVRPILELVSKLAGDEDKDKVRFTHLTCNTKDELKYNLNAFRQLNKLDYGILYLAFHGNPGEIILADDTKINLEALAELMGQDFANWVVHFGTCTTIDVAKKKLDKFITSTQVLLVVGYAKYVDWLESAAMDLLLLDRLQDYKDMKAMWSALSIISSDLIKTTGLRTYPKFN